MLVFLSLLSLAAAAPQYYHPGYPIYPVQPIYYNPAYPIYQTVSVEPAASRGLFTFPGFQQVTSSFVKDTASGRFVEGDVTFKQNILTGSNSQYKVYLKGDNMAGKKYQLGIADSCTGTITNLGNQMTAPSVLLNGFYITGQSSTFNVDGTDSKTSVKTKVLTVKDDAGTLVGCTGAIN